MGAWIDSVELAHPGHDGPEGETHEYSLMRGRYGLSTGSPPMTSRPASGAKLKDGLEGKHHEGKHHCKAGVTLPRGKDAPPV